MKRLGQLGISPTPWFANVYDEVYCNYICNNQKRERVVAETNGYFNEDVADARFIAASPKMYEAAYNLVSAFDRHEMTPEHIEALRAALAEAAGEEVSDGNR